jgi:hypothetical protein
MADISWTDATNARSQFSFIEAKWACGTRLSQMTESAHGVESL